MAECRGCGAHVTERYARVLGDREDNVYRCQNCSTKTDTEKGRMRQ